jgi:glutamine synthetase
MTLKALQAMAKREKVEFIDIKFADLLGRWRHVTLPVESLKQKLFDHGVGVDGSSVSGFAQVKAGDMLLSVDRSSAFIDPFWEHPTMSFIGDVVSVREGKVSPFSRNPRTVAKRAEDFLRKSKIADESRWLPEFEFNLFTSVAYHQDTGCGYYFVDSKEAEWNTGEDDPENYGYQIPYKRGYHAAPPSDQTYEIRSEMCATLKSLGVSIKYHHHEVSGASQQEIEVDFGSLLETADRCMLVKSVVKNTAVKLGMSATFMPKPLYNEPGNGMHFHQYLAKNGKSVFYNSKKNLKLSDTGKYYIGGLLKHAPALLCICSPSTNSYKRLVPGFEAPVKSTYSIANRSAAIRIPGYQLDPSTYNMEFRPPDATCNPYLAIAAQLMAGLDGIRNKIDPGADTSDDITHMSARELSKIPTLPSSLVHAIVALKKDCNFLLEGGVFTEDLIDEWVRVKQNEADAISVRPHPHEFSLYYNC